MEILIWLAVIIISVIGGVALGYQMRKMWAVKKKDSIETQVETLVSEAKAKQKQILLEANDKALKIIEEAKKEEKSSKEELSRQKQRLEQRETLFDQKLLDLENKKQELTEKAIKIEDIKKEINLIKEQQVEKLQKVAGLTKDEAKDVLVKNVEREMSEDLVVRMKKLSMTAADELDKKAKEMLTLAIQRCAVSHAAESTSTTIDLPSDEMKGRIIGREGRNIRAIEKLTGVEIIIDDTPQAITISGFSPIRRHVAKKALEKLISDGRIHPVKIEEAVEMAKKEMAVEIKTAGENALYELGIAGLDPKLVAILGRLKYRTSYGQNILQHSIEIAHLSALLAEMLGADVSVAKKGGLFHDLGKAVDHEIQGGHPQIGYDILIKYGMPEEIACIARDHHDDQPKTLETVIVKVADAISGARPGARKDTYEQYVQRLEELERVATSFEGIEKAYAIQAGREVRVFVVPEEISDIESVAIAKNIAKKIEAELKYPGEIKITVIRETRVIEYAR